MELFLKIWDLFLPAAQPYWAELVGAFLMAIMGNIVSIRGSQKDMFRLLSLAFYAIILRDLSAIGFVIVEEMRLPVFIPPQTPAFVALGLTGLIAALLISAAFKNMKLYFSSVGLVVILTLLFTGISIGSAYVPRWQSIGAYLTSIYLAMGFFVLGASFYINKSSRQNLAIRAIGNGFFVLTICYAYRLFDLIQNVQLVVFLSYTAAVVLALAAQAQLLNLEVEKLEYKLEAERKSKKEAFEISPFPVIISRLRDDSVIYMNPAARQMLLVNMFEITEFKLADYFVDQAQKQSLLEKLRSSSVVKSFEVLVHHPEKNNEFWIDLTTRTTDWDEEIVLFTTFKDITEQKKTAKLLEEQATTDPLTGLYNRRQFEILAYQAIQTASRYNTPYAILMFDIDFFKKVNDTYGHEAGDLVLKKVSEAIKETLRRADVVARYGGEEFVAFLPNTTPDDAKIAAEHVREAVEEMEIPANEEMISVTISIGVSDCQTTNLKALVRQADEALYASKGNGRNQTTMYRFLRRSKKDTNTNKEDA